MKTVRYVIESDGGIFRMESTKTPINVLPTIAKQFQNQVTFRVAGLMDFDNQFYGQCGLVVSTASPDLLTWSTRVRTLNLTTTWSLTGKVLFPDFRGAVPGGTEMTLPWQVPDSMRLMLGVTVLRQAGGSWMLQHHYLAAYDKEGRTWKLPLSNLHEHLEICHGQDINHHTTALKAVQVGLESFRVSRWNDHLTGAHSQSAAQEMFGFDPENQGFKQRPVKEPWTQFCVKVSNEFINANMMPL